MIFAHVITALELIQIECVGTERKAAIKLISPPAKQTKPLIILKDTKEENQRNMLNMAVSTGHGSRSGRVLRIGQSGGKCGSRGISTYFIEFY